MNFGYVNSTINLTRAHIEHYLFLAEASDTYGLTKLSFKKSDLNI